jgi:hypothetical protein
MVGGWDGEHERRKDAPQLAVTLQRFEDRLSELKAQVDRCVSQIESETGTLARAHSYIHDDIEDVRKMVKELRVVMLGNGHVEDSFAHRLLNMESFYRSLRRWGGVIGVSLAGILLKFVIDGWLWVASNMNHASV